MTRRIPKAVRKKILIMHQKGLSPNEIGQRLQVAVSSVERIVRFRGRPTVRID